MNRFSYRNAVFAAAYLLLSLSHAGFARAAFIETVPVGNPGNAPDLGSFLYDMGSVSYNYRIGKYEVTNAQYVQFLNAVDPAGANTLALYSSEMATNTRGGIIFSGSASNGLKYSTKSGRDNNPVGFISWYDAIRFTNWLHNGQGSGDTENGAYTLGALDAEGVPLDGDSITRNPGARWFLPSEGEWYKAAYHKNDGITGNYWLYPTATDALPYSDQPPGTDAPDPSNTANFVRNDGLANGYNDGRAVTGSPTHVDTVNYLTDVGAYLFSASPYGTYDQGGNIYEWTETLIFQSARISRGGWWNSFHENLRAIERTPRDVLLGNEGIGFRVATIVPEPSPLLLAAVAGMGLLWRRRRFVGPTIVVAIIPC
jgi:formylglycine-generating enzyme required for sulfatase activity